MRTDESLDVAIRENRDWEVNNPRTVALIDGSASVTQSRIDGLKASFSGQERNRLFISNKAQTFHDLSGVSGLDSEKDGRVFVKWDFNRDGWTDISIVNTNRPLLEMYRNEFPNEDRSQSTGHFVALRFVGGNRTSEPSATWSARDGYGAKVSLTSGSLKLFREHHCGEGMAAQNSKTMLIGIGNHELVDELVVHWPSGKVQSTSNIRAGKMLTLFEDAEETTSPNGCLISEY